MFDDDLLAAIGAWQNGWLEDQARRKELGIRLQEVIERLPDRFRTSSEVCFRKHFLYKGELTDILISDAKSDGTLSWTTDSVYAERFKGFFRTGAVSAAIFRHKPDSGEVVLNIAALWADPDFVRSADSYRERGGDFADALYNFSDRQGEIVLNAPLRGSEIIALTGISSPFDDLCDLHGIPEEGRDSIFTQMASQGIYTGEWRLLGEEGARSVIERTIAQMHALIAERLASQASREADNS